jgi:hypothetical protein
MRENRVWQRGGSGRMPPIGGVFKCKGISKNEALSEKRLDSQTIAS